METDERGSNDNTPTATATRETVSIDGEMFEETSTPTQTPTETSMQTLEQECTSAYISDFEWQGDIDGEDQFSATVINQGDVAGEVVIQIVFYQSEDESIRTGTIRREASIGAQETRNILIEANPPTEDSNWASMTVSEQACVLDI